MSISKLFVAFILPLVPALALAAGSHDGLSCKGCHSIHKAKGEFIFEVAANKAAKNSKGQAVSGVTALCLGCHEKKEKGGQDYAPVAGHMSHPYGLSSVNPKVAKVPPEGMRDGKFECTGCHDPHPSNPFYAYLRVDTGKDGGNMEKLCAACHSVKADPSSLGKAIFITTMDETRPVSVQLAAAVKK